MTKTHKRKLLIPSVSETNLDNTFVRADQVNAAMNYLSYHQVELGNPIVCLSNTVLATHILARIKMPRLPAHLRTAENIKPKNRLVRLIEKLNWRS